MTPALALVKELLQQQREAGTPPAIEARDKIAVFLAGLGYRIETQRFSFSTSGLLGLPTFGAGLGLLTLLQVPLLVLPGVSAWAALVVWLLGLLAILVMALGLGLGWASLSGERREDANLIATRDTEVRRWIVAHCDTKAQGHSMAGRLVAVWVAGLASLVMSGLAVARLWGPLPTWLMAGSAGLAMVASGLAARGRLKGTSPGARDNGTGLLAALVAAEMVKDPSVGILITSAEEFGLIGARYFAQRCPERVTGTTVINFDTIDDAGLWRVVQHNPDADPLVSRTEAAIRASSPVPVRRHRMPLGIFVDSFPFARAGAVAVTIARLNWKTLRTIHTPRDTPDGLNLDSALLAGNVGAALAAGNHGATKDTEGSGRSN